MPKKSTSQKVKKVKSVSMEGVKKGYCVLIFGENTVSGKCTFTAIKTQKKNGDAIFEITLIKPL